MTPENIAIGIDGEKWIIRPGTHTARHTFATTVLFMNDVPMETAIELLGHTDIRTTQILRKDCAKED